MNKILKRRRKKKVIETNPNSRKLTSSKVLSSPELAYHAARNSPNNLKLEAIIATCPKQSYNYALNIRGTRFEQGEAAISTNAKYSLSYSIDILRSPFELGEPAIATDPNCSLNYATTILGRRFPLGEAAIATHPNCSLLYAKTFNFYFKRGEETVATNADASLQWARLIINGKFELGEKIIATSPYHSMVYSIEVLDGEFKLGEDAIAEDSYCAYKYARMLADKNKKIPSKIANSVANLRMEAQELVDFLIGKKLEIPKELIETVARSGYRSIRYVLNTKCRFIEGEKQIIKEGYLRNYMEALSHLDSKILLDIKVRTMKNKLAYKLLKAKYQNELRRF